MKTHRESLEVCVCVPFLRNRERKSVFKCKCDRVLRVLTVRRFWVKRKEKYERRIYAKDEDEEFSCLSISVCFCLCY